MKLTKESEFIVDVRECSVIERLAVIQVLCKVTGEDFDDDAVSTAVKDYDCTHIGIMGGAWVYPINKQGVPYITYAEWLAMVGEPEKLDAYFKPGGNGGYTLTDQNGDTYIPSQAYLFNILSQVEFLCKYPPGLRLNGVQVKQDDNPNWMRIGPITLSKDAVRNYMSVSAALNEKAPGYEFFMKHSKELEL